MPLRASRTIGRNAFGFIGAVLVSCALMSHGARGQGEDDSPTQGEIIAAIEKLRADPNLSGERQTRALRWAGEDDSKPQERGDLAQWIKNFFAWLGQLSRALVWVIGALLGLALVWFLVRLFGTVASASAPRPAVVPTHVRELDIRPESLPDDIGAAALELWQQGQHRAALALLYRGLLSRLAHEHQVPIRDSTTEGDCLALAKQHLQPERGDYVARLIGVWQRATYGGREPDANEVQALCAGFDAALAHSSTSTSGVSV